MALNDKKGNNSSITDDILMNSTCIITLKSNILSIIIIRIHHKSEGRIEKSVPSITDWHHEACRVMTHGDPEGWIFLSYPQTNNGFFFLLAAAFLF